MPKALTLLLATLAAVLLSTASAHAAKGPPPAALDCAKLPCNIALPGALSFEDVPGAPYKLGKNAAGETVGWVVMSTDIVDIKAYSGKPLVTLVGLTPEGVVAGARVVHHSEPIILVGIPEQELHDFAAKFAGVKATQRVTVGATSEKGVISVDVVSGATVTVLAENQTIMDSARALGEAVGVVQAEVAVPGHFVAESGLWTWDQMVQKKVFGRLTLSDADMGLSGSTASFIDIYFTIADAPQVGKALLGEREYEFRMKQLAPGEHLLVVFGNGSSSFKGSGFVRGGIFDRVRLEQGLKSVIFHDYMYASLQGALAQGAPSFKEGALFRVPAGKLDPGLTYSLVFLGSRYNQRGGFSRDFQETKSDHRLPKSVYVLDGPDPESRIWRDAWARSKERAAVLGALLLLIVGVFAARRVTTRGMKRLQALHLVSMVVALGVFGLWLRVQPSVTQVLTFVGSITGEWRLGLFLSEPLLFVFWIFIAVVTVVWGRGVFCGWACPYGALTELLFKLGRLLRLPAFELPERFHRPARWVRYVVLAVLIGAFLKSPELGERLAEVEPFKTTFYVKPWARQLGYLIYWVVLLAVAVVMYRPFCRYLCPLGAALAIPGSLRLSGPYRRAFCTKCTICTRGCEPRAIRSDGSIDPRECLSCMECEANYRDEQVCPPLIAIDRLKKRGPLGPKELEKTARLRRDAKKVKQWRLPG
jgi:NosR/NirI family nitrous oxide reductase transcriptional regulator